jgi:hypothetical protein
MTLRLAQAYHRSCLVLKAAFCSITLLVGIAYLSIALVPVASAQTNISGDITGTVTDSTGAAIPGATITVMSKSTGATKMVPSNGRGEYRVPLLAPGDYQINVAASGFEGGQTVITVASGSVANGDVKLTLGKASTTVEVTSAQPLLHTDDAQISTSFTQEQIQSLPNPGNDLTFVAQTTPGVVMDTLGGAGNFSVNGLPGTSNTFTINGGYEGDPYLNLNNSGATNLLLGNNDISDVTVIANAFDAAFGGLGGAQVNEISRTGGNGYHGNATYYWNGAVLNANSYFNKCGASCGNTVTGRNFDNVNQYNAAFGGPIKKDKAFFFVNYEGIRIVIPITGSATGPSPAYQAAILNPTAMKDSVYAPYGNLAYNGNYAEAPLYQAMFNYYNNARNFLQGSVDPNDPKTQNFTGQTTNFAREYLVTARTDFNLGVNDRLFIHSKVDQGVQPTTASFLNPVFNANSPQPSYEGQLGETHTFSPNVTNQFLFAASYYRAIFVNTNASSLVAAGLPFVLVPEGFATGSGDWDVQLNDSSWVGGADFAFPQGRNVTGYQFSDDLSWTRGNHTLKFGYTFRRDDVTDYTPSEHVTANAGAENVILDEGNFAAGYSDEWVERFPTRASDPAALYVSGAYVQDQWKALPNLTVTAGLRLEHNSNPICRLNCLANISAPWQSLSTDTNTPYNQLLNAGRSQAFYSQQNIAYEPRFGFSWLPGGPGSHTTVRGGFGMFADYFPAQIIGGLLANSPNVNRFTVLGAAYGNPIEVDPAASNSGHADSLISEAAFTSPTTGFAAGGSYNSLFAATGGLFRRPTVDAAAPKFYLPSYEEFSLGVEHQFTRTLAASVQYVGNHGYHEPTPNLPNAYDPYPGDNIGLPASLPNPNFASVTDYYSGSSSNYNGLQTTVTDRMRWITLQFNYVYSHGLDEVSNGGFNAFSVNPNGQINPNNLAQQYGNADYDVKNYISGSYVINVPYLGGPHMLVDGWQLAGTVFHNTGFPFTITQDEGTIIYGNAALAAQIGNDFDHKCGGESHTVINNPCSYNSAFTFSNNFGQQGRNGLRGPNYSDFDLDISKNIKLRESMNLRLGAQFFNLANHPNFMIPLADVTDGIDNGRITTTASTPTSILGSALGGDASPRLIQLKGTFVF